MSDSKPVPSALEHLAVRLQDVSDAWWKEHASAAPRPIVTFEIPPSAPAPRVGSLVDEIIAEAAAAEREACAQAIEAMAWPVAEMSPWPDAAAVIRARGAR